MKYLLTILLIFTCAFSFAQKFSTSIDVQLAVPQGDYKDVNPDAGFGLRANFLYKPGKVAPVKFGIEFRKSAPGHNLKTYEMSVFGSIKI